MGIYPVPDLASVGMVTDIPTSSSGISAWTMASNVRFQDGKISRAPVFSSYASLTTNPRHMFHYVDEVGTDHFLLKDQLGFTYEEDGNGGAANVSPTGYAATSSDQPVTSCSLSNVVYFNRPDGSPQWRPAASGGKFALLSSYDSGTHDPAAPNQSLALPANVRFAALRSFNSRLIGLGVTEGGLFAPNTVYWSDVADQNGKPPKSWANDPAGTEIATNSTGGAANLAEMRGNIIDGHRFSSTFLIFSREETWRMDALGDVKNVFQFQRVLGSGLMSANCACEVESRLFCFGDKDIFYTDGATMQSIAVSRIRDFVYSNISNLNRAQSFVFHNPNLKEIYFCFASNDAMAAFPLKNGNIGANRAAVYNYVSDCWSLYDMPYVTHASLINTFNGPTFDQLNNVTFDQMTGSFNGMLDGAKDVVAFCSNSSVDPKASAGSIRTFSPYAEGVASGAVDMFALAPVLLIKAPMDGSELSKIEGVAKRICETANIAHIWIHGSINPTNTVYVYLSVTDEQGDTPYYNTFDMTWTADYSKLDYDMAGRFIGLKLMTSSYKDFQISGIDIDMKILGSRSR